MEQASLSVASPSRDVLLRTGRFPSTTASAVNAAAISALRGSSSSSSTTISGLVISEGRHEIAAEWRLQCGGLIGSWMEFGRRFDGCRKARGIGGNYSFHKGALQPARCHKMFVPGFGEKSPEAKAADSLHNFFTFVAVKIVLSQLQDYNREGYEDLMDFVDRVSLKDGDKFCATLMRESFRHKQLALRIMEVRSAYSKTDFEWDNLQKLCNKHMEEANTGLMRQFLVETSEYKE